MKSRIITTAFALAASATLVFSSVDHHPKNSGTSQTRNAVGSTYEGAYNNPALLGVERPPTGGLLIPPFTDLGAGFWSNKLYLKPYDAWFGDFGDKEAKDVWKDVVEEMLVESFDLEGLDPDETTEKMAQGLEGGVSLYAGARASLLSLSFKRFAIDVTTHLDQQVLVPEGIWYIMLDDVGLLPGNTLDLSNFRQDLLWATDVTFSLGLPLQIPALNKFFKLKYSAGGVGLKYVMGHSILHAQATKGELTYNEATNSYDVNTQIEVQSAGTGFYGAWDMADGGPFQNGLPVNGHGIGIDVGGVLYDDNGSLTINISDLGVLFWIKETREVTYKLKKNGLDYYDIQDGIDRAEEGPGDPTDDQVLTEIFDRNAGEYISDSRDTLEESQGFVSMLPLTFNIGYAYKWNYTYSEHRNLKYLFEDITLGGNYQQQLTRGPGRSLIPRLSIGSEAGALRNWLPLRMGFILGGPELFGSTLGFGINARYWQFNFAYKAVGDLIFRPHRGMEVAAGMGWNWGVQADDDKDGIINRKDKCPRDPEDYDDFEDEDGCPDYDNDKDGITDLKDKCPLVPEDKDGFEDWDGCPDYDNDKDGIPDTTDKCPIEAEDKDGFEDLEGCPDYDNDKDSIPDTTDKCINDPEIYNGYLDQDGCPDSMPKPSASEEKALVKELAGVKFKTGSAQLTKKSFDHLKTIANFLRQYAHLRYEIQGHTDAVGKDDYNLLLSAARAKSVSNYLLSQGIPDSQLIAIGYGETKPIDDNKTAKGRAKNRRVQFVVIETKDDYSRLKALEEDFKERVRRAKIRGAEY